VRALRPSLLLAPVLLALGSGCLPFAAAPPVPPAPPAGAAAPVPMPGAATAPIPAAAAAPPASPQPSFLPDHLLENLPPPLPPPDPLPETAPRPLAVADADPLELLWSHRLDLGAGGQPIVTIRIAEGLEQVALRTVAPSRLSLRGGEVRPLPAGSRVVVRVRDGAPARLEYAPLLGDAPASARAQVEAQQRAWEARGVRVRRKLVGGVYGIAGRVVDNRRELILADGPGGDLVAVQARAAELSRRFGQRVPLHAEPLDRPRGTLVVATEAGPAGEADGALAVEPDGEAGAVVEGLPAADGKGGREERRYRGRLLVAVDASGALAVVDALPLEALLRGLVPSEMPAGSPLQALQAQAVTARSNVLAQIGTRHLGDPYALCSEVHCQAYHGSDAERPRTDQAVRATAGEAIFGRADRTLVDGVYSAMCGGHGEDAVNVWGGTPGPSLRGQPDLPPEEAARWPGGLRDEARLRRFLAEPPDAWCRRPASATKGKFRWERRFSPSDLDGLTQALGVGPVRGLAVLERGVSGRALALRVEGLAGAAEVRGELAIRRLLRNLPSSMFVLDRDGRDWLLHGGGWGHGAGMCQWGAIGRAEGGQGYREILEASFPGAEVVRIY